MATTTNYSWSTPDDTALVKDGAAAIRSLGTAIDSTVFTNAGAAIAKTIVDAKGDLIAATGADAVTRVAVGTNGQYLKADSTASGGIAWDTLPPGGGITLIQESVASANSAIDFTSISGSYKNLVLQWQGIYHSTTLTGFSLRFNSDSGSNYKNKRGFIQNVSANAQIGSDTEAGNEALGYNSDSTTLQNTGMGVLTIYNYASTSKFKQYTIDYAYTNTSGTTTYFNIQGTWASTNAITEVNIFRSAGAGTLSNAADTSIRLYGEA